MHKIQIVYKGYKLYGPNKFIKFDLRRTKGAPNMVSIKTSQRGLHKGWIRNTFILKKEYSEKIKTLAYRERKRAKDAIDEVLGEETYSERGERRWNFSYRCSL